MEYPFKIYVEEIHCVIAVSIVSNENESRDEANRNNHNFVLDKRTHQIA